MRFFVRILRAVVIGILAIVYAKSIYIIATKLCLMWAMDIKLAYSLMVILYTIPAIIYIVLEVFDIEGIIVFYVVSTMYLWYRIVSEFARWGVNT